MVAEAAVVAVRTTATLERTVRGTVVAVVAAQKDSTVRNFVVVGIPVAGADHPVVVKGTG